MIEYIPIEKIKLNKNNPRFIKDEKFYSLVQSIKKFPKMLKLRPIVVNNEMVVLGGNMRLKACKEAGLEKVWVEKAKELTPEEEREFIIKDNVGFGEWDWDVLANDYDHEELMEWGLDVPDVTKMPDVPSILETMTFQLTVEQKALIKTALAQCAQSDDFRFKDYINENLNGNALFCIVKQWLENQ